MNNLSIYKKNNSRTKGGGGGARAPLGPPPNLPLIHVHWDDVFVIIFFKTNKNV